MNKKKVLIVVNSFTQNNGVTNCMMNYYDELVTHSSCVDFLVLKKKLLKMVERCFIFQKLILMSVRKR